MINIQKTSKLELFDRVDITDPCYDEDTWCRISYPCVLGEYETYHTPVDEGEWGIRISRCAIIHQEYLNCFDDDPTFMDGEDFIGCAIQYGFTYEIEEIGVGAGFAGFFDNKPDFTDSDWDKFCNSIKDGKVFNLSFDGKDGFFTHSGYGDGCYRVYSIFDDSFSEARFIAGVIEFIEKGE